MSVVVLFDLLPFEIKCIPTFTDRPQLFWYWPYPTHTHIGKNGKRETNNRKGHFARRKDSSTFQKHIYEQLAQNIYIDTFIDPLIFYLQKKSLVLVERW